MTTKKLYAVCENLQKKEIDEYCFKACGYILVGGLVYNDLYWCPCCQVNCPYLDREKSVGKVTLEAWGDEELILRKLKPFVGVSSVNNKE